MNTRPVGGDKKNIGLILVYILPLIIPRFSEGCKQTMAAVVHYSRGVKSEIS